MPGPSFPRPAALRSLHGVQALDGAEEAARTGPAAKPAPAPAAKPRRAKILTRSTLGPALGIGVIVAFLAGPGHAPLAISVLVGLVVAAVVVGMIAVKRTFYGD